MKISEFFQFFLLISKMQPILQIPILDGEFADTHDSAALNSNLLQRCRQLEDNLLKVEQEVDNLF